MASNGEVSVRYTDDGNAQTDFLTEPPVLVSFARMSAGRKPRVDVPFCEISKYSNAGVFIKRRRIGECDAIMLSDNCIVFVENVVKILIACRPPLRFRSPPKLSKKKTKTSISGFWRKLRAPTMSSLCDDSPNSGCGFAFYPA